MTKAKGLTVLFFLLSALFIAGALFFSCEVALGTKLDLEGPTVTLTKPDFMANVGADFSIEGTVTDDHDITFLNVTIEGIEQQWRNDRGSWQTRENSGAPWTPYGEATWTVLDGGKRAAFTLPVHLNGQEGEYLISVTAVDNSQNSTANSLQQRRVVFDQTEPVLKIHKPTLEPSSGSWETTFGGYVLKDIAVLDKLLNGEVAVKWEINDNFSVDSLTIELVGKDGKVYFIKEIPNVTRNGSIGIKAAEIIDPDTGTPVSDKKYLSIITTAFDKAQNKEYRKHNGWFVYYPDADIPWAAAPMHASTPRDYTVYPGYPQQGQAHDDDGIKYVRITVYKGTSSSSGAYSSDPVDGFPLEVENAPLSGGKRSGSFNWDFDPPSAPGNYKIEVEAVDINEVSSNVRTGNTFIGYFEVVNTTAPSVDKIELPDPSKTLFGDADGKFTISGTASDGAGLSKLSLVWINPGHSSDIGKYTSAAYEGWSNASSPSAGTDSNGNKVWDITPAGSSGTSGGREQYSFSQDLNLFSDLNIGKEAGKNPLKGQTFIIRAVGNSGRAVTRTLAVRGDIDPPKIAITKVKVGSATYEMPYSGTLPSLKSETVTLSGTWDDDSLPAWQNNTPARMTATVTWNGTSVGDITLDANKTWSAAAYTPSGADLTAGFASIAAELKDLGGNITVATASLMVDTAAPVLVRISSDKDNGTYKAGEGIPLYMEFNKAVRFTGSGNPSLSMSTGNSGNGTAAYVSGNGTNKHNFTYTVRAGDNIDKLNVTAITTSGLTYKSVVSEDTVTMSVPASNLANNKAFTLDTTAPTLKSIAALSSVGHYNAGKVIYLKATFSEPVTLASGDPSFTLNSHGSSATAVYQGAMGDDSLLFAYTVAGGHNAAELSASSFSLGGGSIRDGAGNVMTSATLPTSMNIHEGSHSKTIVIDTTPPTAPTVSGNPSGGDLTGLSAYSFTVTVGEANAAVEYKVSASGTWLPYTAGASVTLTSAGTYAIQARQTDQAGNVSVESTAINVTIVSTSPLLTTISSTNGPGTKGTGTSITIVLNLREAVTVTAGAGTTYPRLKLNLKNASGIDVDKYATFTTSSSPSNTLTFTYTVAEGDNTSGYLEVKEIDLQGATLTNTSGAAVALDATHLSGTLGSAALSANTPMEIKTGKPKLTAVDLDTTGMELKLTFDRTVYKGTGNITLTQADNYLAPAVLSTNDYAIFNAGNAIATYYTKGTNGTNTSGVFDLTEKYVLNYATDTNDTTLVGLLKGKNADKAIISVSSSSVTIASEGSLTNNQLKVALTGSNALRVKGVSYDVTFAAGIVRDSQSAQAEALAGSSPVNNRKAVGGVNAPVIRVQKEKAGWVSTSVLQGTRQEEHNYWIKDDAQISLTDPSDSTDWVKIASYQMTDYTAQAAQPTDTAGWKSMTGYGSITEISVADKSGQSDWIRPSSGSFGVTASEFSSTTQTGDGWIELPAISTVPGSNGKLYSKKGTSPAEFKMSNYEDPASWEEVTTSYWVKISNFTYAQHYLSYVDTNSFPLPRDKVWVKIDQIAAQESLLTGTPIGKIQFEYWLKLGSGVWGSSTGSTVQVAEYWVKRGTGTWTEDDKAGTAGYVKYSETVTVDLSSITSQVAVQPIHAEVKIDCQTPGAGLKYSTTAIETPTQVTPNGSNVTAPTVSMPSSANTSYNHGSTTITLGSDDKTKGGLYGIRADAAKGGTTATAYEKAARSVIWFNNPPAFPAPVTSNTASQLWLRGGDDASGASRTPGFPLSWDINDGAGARLMTRDGTANNWYWISWEVNAPAYTHFVAGTTDDNATDLAAKGPVDWCMSKNAWSYLKDKYLLHPGASLLFIQRIELPGQPAGYYEWPTSGYTYVNRAIPTTP